MADRFPSLEDFDAGVQTGIQDASADPSTSNFLEREKAVLGDDAMQFATVTDPHVDDGGDLLDSGGDAAAMSSFESQFPDITADNEAVAPGGTITGPSVNFSSGYAAHAEDEEEPEVIKLWREKRDAQVAKRAQQFAAEREETVKQAQQNIDDFYENYNNKKEKTIAQTRKEAEEFLANREDVTSGGTSWERISKLVDLSGKGPVGGASGSGKERFRELLLSLRKDEKAPGAAGY
ncbi:hypothetical protein P8C59_006652 [Phyllachora maydis]|uniref:Clathrin light chain n=1 Tax=Phyllachora maydis TaxID=1825666 RepID=A0AAD9I838_9PEZI|nr:hypothetical protein P8C59_006652 [Phyllachora maydis]